MPHYFSQPTLLLIVGLGLLVAGALVVLTLGWRRKRGDADTRRKLAPPRNRPNAEGPPVVANFIGREEELRQILQHVRGREASLILVSGPAGAGKRSLLGEVRLRARLDVPPVMCGPVVDLSLPRDVQTILEGIANELAHNSPGSMKPFFSALAVHRAKAAGLPTPAEGVIAAVVDTASTITERSAPFMGTVLRGTAGQIVAGGAATIVQGPGDEQSVEMAFLTGLKELARERAVALFFDRIALGESESDEGVRGFTERFLPNLAGLVTVIAASTEHAGSMLGRLFAGRVVHNVNLEPLPAPQVRRAVDALLLEATGVVNDQLADTMVTQIEGSPQKLAAYRTFVRQNPDLIKEAVATGRTPDAAAAWLNSGESYRQLKTVGNAWYRRLVRASAPLRWLNIQLLEQIAKSSLAPAPDGTEPAGLLTEDVPPWIVADYDGWRLEPDRVRQAIADDLRRTDPAAWRRAHLEGARYHLSRILRREVRDDEDLFDPQATEAEGNALGDEDPSLQEYLHHLSALDSEQAFACVSRKAAEALFDSAPSVAERLCRRSPEVDTSSQRSLQLSLLAKGSVAMEEGKLQDLNRRLEQALAVGGLSPTVMAVLSLCLGRARSQFDDQAGASAAFRHVIEWTSHSDDKLALKARCLAHAEMGLLLARAFRALPTFVAEFTRSSEVAERLGQPPDLVVEIQASRARALISAEAFDEAIPVYDEIIRKLGPVISIHRVLEARRGLAEALAQSKEPDWQRIERQFHLVRAAYQEMEDPASEATVLQERRALALMRGDRAAADEYWQAAVALDGTSAGLWNLDGNDLAARAAVTDDPAERDELLRQAVDRYTQALTRLKPGDETSAANFYYNRGRTYESMQDSVGWLEDIGEALQRAPDDEQFILEYVAAALRDGTSEEVSRAEQLMGELIDRLAGYVRRVPGDAYTRARLADAYFRAQRYDEARSELDRLLVNEPDEPMHLMMVADCLRLQGDIRAAAEWSAHAMRTAVESPMLARWARERWELALSEWSGYGDDLLPPPRRITLDWLEEGAPALLGDKAGEPRLRLQLGMLGLRIAQWHLDAADRSASGFDERDPAVVLTRSDSQYVEDLLRWAIDEVVAASSTAGPGDGADAAAELLQDLAVARPGAVREEEVSTVTMAAFKAAPTNSQLLIRQLETFPSDDRVLAELDAGRGRTFGTMTLSSVLRVAVSEDLVPWLNPDAGARGRQFIDEMLGVWRQEVRDQLGFWPPGVRLREEWLPRSTFVVRVLDVEQTRFTMPAPYVADLTVEDAVRLGIAGTEGPAPWLTGPGLWIEPAVAPRLNAEGVEVWDPRGVIAEVLMQVARDRGDRLANVDTFVAAAADEQSREQLAARIAEGDLVWFAEARADLRHGRVPARVGGSAQ